MRKALRICKRLLVDSGGPTAVEYAVMLALVVALCLPSVYALGVQSRTSFFKVMMSLAQGS